MKTCIKNLFLLPALIVGLDLMPAGPVTAQTFTNLHSFNYFDGDYPRASLLLSGNTLYGTTDDGGPTLGGGTVFKLNTDDTGFSTLHGFTDAIFNSAIGAYVNSDGVRPEAGLLLSGNTLYGTALEGGTSGSGTVFKVNTDGTGFTTLYSFTVVAPYPDHTNSDGAWPLAGLILSGDTLYGTASVGGTSGQGTVFAIKTNGTGFTNLHIFTSGSDGADPSAGLILSGNTLYGTTTGGGSSGNGTVFAVNTDGTGFTNLYSFTATSGAFSSNNDGANPDANLILSDNILYGTANAGGSSGNGTVFAVNTDGTGFTNLHSLTFSEGAYPSAGLILSGNTLYGTAAYRGSSGEGTVFAVNTDGTGFTNLHLFTATSGSLSTNSDGGSPIGGLVLFGNTLYGTAAEGGHSGAGTVFSLSLGSVSAVPPTLTIIPHGTNVILTWPTNAAGFTLQFTTNLGSQSVWITNTFASAIVNGQNAVTNPISGARKFYRLSQ